MQIPKKQNNMENYQHNFDRRLNIFKYSWKMIKQ